MHWESSFSNNAIIVISAPRNSESNVARRLCEDIEQIRIATHYFHFEHHSVVTRQELIEVLRGIERKSKKGLRPIIHFDMHGDKARGLEISASREFASWQELVTWLRKINIKAKNNLCIVAAACYGLHLIRPISILHPVPFYCLIAPQDIVSLGFVDDKMALFYKRLLEEGDLKNAFSEISEAFEQFHCEKMITIVLARYIKNACKGAKFERRKERLISEALALGLPKTKDSLRQMRQLLKSNLRPSESLIEKYVARFLIRKDYPITLDEIKLLVEESYA